MKFTREELDEKIAAAWKLERKFQELCEEEKELDPLLDKVEFINNENLEYLLDKLPAGFHRGELRGILRRRKNWVEWCKKTWKHNQKLMKGNEK